MSNKGFHGWLLEVLLSAVVYHTLTGLVSRRYRLLALSESSCQLMSRCHSCRSINLWHKSLAGHHALYSSLELSAMDVLQTKVNPQATGARICFGKWTDLVLVAAGPILPLYVLDEVVLTMACRSSLLTLYYPDRSPQLRNSQRNLPSSLRTWTSPLGLTIWMLPKLGNPPRVSKHGHRLPSQR